MVTPSCAPVRLTPVVSSALALLALATGGPALASTVWYVGDGPSGRPMTLELAVEPDGSAAGRAFDTPPREGQPTGLELRFRGAASGGDDLRVAANVHDARGPTGARLSIRADLDRTASPGEPRPSALGSATLTFVPAGGVEPAWTATLQAVGTRLSAKIALDDTTVEVVAATPFFYAQPWRGLRIGPSLDAFAESAAAGLTQRAQRPTGATSTWWDERTVHLASLGPDIVSARTRVSDYTGGAHPDLRFAFATWIRDGDGWRGVDLCGTLAALDRRCDPGALRAHVIRALRAQDAAWAVDGELDATTPWLLDPFTIGPSGVRLDYAPYAVGPYAQGPFAVEIPFDRLHELSRGRGASDP